MLKIKISIYVLFLFLLTSSVLAAPVKLLSIGGLNTQGLNYSEWWYTGLNPSMGGSANPNETVTIKINDETFTVNSDENGMWAFQTTDRPQGDYNITLSNSESTYNFVLHLGQNAPGTEGTTTTSTIGTNTTETSTTTETVSENPVPDTGLSPITAIATSLGVLSIGLYLYLFSQNRALKAFEKENS